MRACRTAALLALVCVLASGALQEAAALRVLNHASPLLAFPWMPYQDEAGAWHPATNTSADFSKMVLMDLPPPELYLRVALTAPYPVPQLPLERIINNTLKDLAGAKVPTNANDWLQVVGSAGNYLANSLPGFMQKALGFLLEGIKVNGEPLKALPGLNLDASKALETLPQLLNMTLIGMKELPKLVEALPAEARPNITLLPEMNATLDDLKKIPELLLPKDGMKVEDLRKLPAVLQQVAQTTANAAEMFAKQFQVIQTQLPPLPRTMEALLDEGAALNLRNFIQTRVNVPLPGAVPLSKILAELAKGVTPVLSQLGVQVEGLPHINLEALEKAFKLAAQDGLFIQDKAGRVDLLATITQLPEKVPVLQKLLLEVVPSTEMAKVTASLGRLQRSLSKMADVTQAVVRPGMIV